MRKVYAADDNDGWSGFCMSQTLLACATALKRDHPAPGHSVLPTHLLCWARSFAHPSQQNSQTPQWISTREMLDSPRARKQIHRQMDLRKVARLSSCTLGREEEAETSSTFSNAPEESLGRSPVAKSRARRSAH